MASDKNVNFCKISCKKCLTRRHRYPDLSLLPHKAHNPRARVVDFTSFVVGLAGTATRPPRPSNEAGQHHAREDWDKGPVWEKQRCGQQTGTAECLNRPGVASGLRRVAHHCLPFPRCAADCEPPHFASGGRMPPRPCSETHLNLSEGVIVAAVPAAVRQSSLR
jgi:hypothetical protein